MKKMYEIIIKTSEEDCIIANRLAENEEELKNIYGGNGEIIRIQLTKNFPISKEKVYNALKLAEFGETELMAIWTLLDNYDNIQD